MRAGAGLHRQDPLRRDQAAAAQALGVLAGDEIVGHHGEAEAAALQGRDQVFDQRRLAGADRPADADARRRRKPGGFSDGAHRSM